MKKINIFALLFLCLFHSLSAIRNDTTPTLILRSQGFHADRQRMVGMADQVYVYDNEACYGTIDIGASYSRSFRADQLANALFGIDLFCDCAPTIKVQGSSVKNRDPKAWLADYMYLPCGFDGSFSIKPQIENVCVDFDFYLGLDSWVPGTYFRIYGPLVWTKWQTNFCEGESTGITTTCTPGYFTPYGTEKFLDSITAYLRGDAPATTGGVTFRGLEKAKIDCACDDTFLGFSEVRFMLGWNFLQDEDYHVGINLNGAAPTGTRREGTRVMQPVIGNGNHWEIGAGFNFHNVFWRSEDEEKHIGIYFDSILSHAFTAVENRTFDIDDKDNSRYMLLAQFDAPAALVGDLMAANNPNNSAASLGVLATASPGDQFDNVYSPLANLSTVNVDCYIPLQWDLALMFNFTVHGFSWDIGYNYWGHIGENIAGDSVNENLACSNVTLANQSQVETWAFKGDAHEFGYQFSTEYAVIPLSATQSDATIHSGTNATATASDGGDPVIRNFGVDSASFAYADSAGAGTTINRVVAYPGAPNEQATHIKTSTSPVFLRACELAYTQQSTQGMSHSVFTHMSYQWERNNWSPYLGFGGSAEFGKGLSCGEILNSSQESCSSTNNCKQGSLCAYVPCAITQWSAWIKAGISFY